MKVNKYARLRERINEEVHLIVTGAPIEQEKRSGYVIDQCLMLEHSGLTHADQREVEDEVRKRLNLPAWGT